MDADGNAVPPRSYVCGFEGCPIVSASRAEHIRHKRSHTESIGRFQCPRCSSAFATKLDLMDHARVDHGLQAGYYRCNVCGRTLSTQSNLTVHMQIHRAERIPEFACPHCPMAYFHRSALHRHQRKEHGMEKKRRGRKRSTGSRPKGIDAMFGISTGTGTGTGAGTGSGSGVAADMTGAANGGGSFHDSMTPSESMATSPRPSLSTMSISTVGASGLRALQIQQMQRPPSMLNLDMGSLALHSGLRPEVVHGFYPLTGSTQAGSADSEALEGARRLDVAAEAAQAEADADAEAEADAAAAAAAAGVLAGEPAAHL
eukprot:jgi/Hompol1/2396/HPOL_005999-RA